MRLRTQIWMLPLLALPLLLIPACGNDSQPTAPLSAPIEEVARATTHGDEAVDVLGHRRGGGSGFFPLEMGNHWSYERVFVVETVEDDGSTSTEVFNSTSEHEIIGTQELFGREYVVEEIVIDEGEFGLTTRWNRYRQDRAGLYEADVSGSDPPSAQFSKGNNTGALDRRTRGLDCPEGDDATAAAWRDAYDRLETKLAMIRSASASSHAFSKGRPGGVESDEITRLAYPLRPSASWTVREAPFFGSVVERRELLELPAGKMTAWRVRMESEVFGDEDQVHFWYSGRGYLGLRAKLESEATDENGNVIGTLKIHDEEFLSAMDISRGPRNRGLPALR